MLSSLFLASFSKASLDLTDWTSFVDSFKSEKMNLEIGAILFGSTTRCKRHQTGYFRNHLVTRDKIAWQLNCFFFVYGAVHGCAAACERHQIDNQHRQGPWCSIVQELDLIPVKGNVLEFLVCKNELLLNGREISVQSGIEQLRHSCVR
jgi:hypothetical protein